MASMAWSVLLLLLVCLHSAHAGSGTTDTGPQNPVANDTGVVKEDYVFIVQIRCDMNDTEKQMVKDFIIAAILKFGENRTESAKDDVRFGVIYYGDKVHQVFGYPDGITRRNVQDGIKKIQDTVFENPENCSHHNLTGAMEAAYNLSMENTPEFNAINYIFKTDGQDDGDPMERYHLCGNLHDNNATVIVVSSVAMGVSKRDLQERDANQQANILELVLDIKWFLEVTDQTEGDATSIVDIIAWKISIFSVSRVCDTSTWPCHKTCGIGLHAVDALCTFYVNGQLFGAQSYTFVGRCCIEPCSGGGAGPPNIWNCKDLPPRNGHNL